MEDVLAVYKRPYDPKRPVVCMDESSRQLLGDVREPLPPLPCRVKKVDHEYKRGGTANLFMFFEPLAGWREVAVTERRTRVDWARQVEKLCDVRYPSAEKIVLVLDNLNVHSGASLYEAFEPKKARRLLEKLEIHYTPKHGSWLNMAEIELSVLQRQCLRRRLASMEKLTEEVAAWSSSRNERVKRVEWRFTTPDARIKLKSLYPTME
jgi:transposase